MIKKFKEFIEEGRMSRILAAADNDEKRKEDKSIFETQVEKMEYVDMGLPSGTLWAKKDLHDIDDVEFLGYEEYKKDYLDDIVILPTKKQFDELIKNCDFSKVSDGVYKLTSKINGAELIFDENYDHHYGKKGSVYAKEIEIENGEKFKYYPLPQWPCYTASGNVYKYHVGFSKTYRDETGDFGKSAMLIRVVKNK